MTRVTRVTVEKGWSQHFCSVLNYVSILISQCVNTQFCLSIYNWAFSFAAGRLYSFTLKQLSEITDDGQRKNSVMHISV